MGKVRPHRTNQESLQPMSERRSIAVYCASSTKLRQEYYDVAREVGRQLAMRGATLLNGAGNMGLMRASADGCLQAGGRAIGVIPKFMVEQGWHYPGMTELIEVCDMSERKNTLATMSDGSIVLAGGCGTLDEMFELITNKQLGLYTKPIAILNTLGFYDHLLAHLQRCVGENFMRAVHAQMWKTAGSPAEAVDVALSGEAWDADLQRLAKI